MEPNPITIDDVALNRHYLTKLNTIPTFRLKASPEALYQHLVSASKAQTAATRGGEFAPLSDAMLKAIEGVARYLTEPGASNGLLIMGNVGTGKTTLVKALAAVIAEASRQRLLPPATGMGFVTADRLADVAKTDDATYRAYEKAERLAIDDLGTEPAEVVEYGNILTPLTAILTRRYERRAFTVLTTNCTPAELKDRYGARLADRMREWMHRIVLSGPSLR